VKSRASYSIWFGGAALAAGLGLLARAEPPESKVHLGDPMLGLTQNEMRLFGKGKAFFQHNFSISEGLGPLFNGKSCFECHGMPKAAGGEGHDVASTGVLRIGARKASSRSKSLPDDQFKAIATEADVDLLLSAGGPALSRKSITNEFRTEFPLSESAPPNAVPTNAAFLGLRHAGPLFGSGLLEAIPDADILKNAERQSKLFPKLAGRAIYQKDIITGQRRLGRFGWKNQHPSALSFSAEAENMELGVTNPFKSSVKLPSGQKELPPGLRSRLPKEPNDNGTKLFHIAYFQALLAPPAPAAPTAQTIKGEQLFEKLQCAVCHQPEMKTAAKVFIVEPELSAAGKPEFRQAAVLENKPVRLYSDLLLHSMGSELADGLPQSGAKGGEWRSTPLWGLRFKRFYLHDGRTEDLVEAIESHGGQAAAASKAFSGLSEEARSDLLAFLKSL